MRCMISVPGLLPCDSNMKGSVTWLAIVFLLVTSAAFVNSSHFRGGTISWRPIGNNKVEFFFKMGWTFSRGPGCTQNLIGQYVNQPMTGGNNGWKCQSGCPPNTPDLHPVSYYCMAASMKENWEQGQDSFNYTFQNAGPFTVGYAGKAWMQLAGGKGDGDWNIATTVDLRTRSDTNRPNSSPNTLSKPLYFMQYNCHHELHIPVLDPDGDEIRCRWATGSECETVCKALPGAILDEKTCPIVFNSTSMETYAQGGHYAVALTIEDFPRNPITLGGNDPRRRRDRLSSIPMQFLIKIPTYPEPCDWVPRFVTPTPAESEVITVQEGETLNVGMYADNGNHTSKKITAIEVIGPVNLQQSPLHQDKSQVNTFYKDLTWATTGREIGEHLACANVENEVGKSGSPRCFTIKVVPDPCKSAPCQNRATCVSSKGNFTCACVPGFTDPLCSTDIDDCKSGPCQNGATCTDLINAHRCNCAAGYTGQNCQIDIDDCKSAPCQNGATCIDLVNAYQCNCVAGYTGQNCQIDTDDCKSAPCQNGATCKDLVNAYQCTCAAGYTGQNCQIDIDDCQSAPCQNGATCIDLINSYQCNCAAGYTGQNCQIDFDDCQSAPCQNGATCIDLVNGYQCNCAAGYSGQNCQIDIDECQSAPCQNGATCIDLVNAYQCNCVAGYTGQNCQIDIDECQSAPCQNGATCIDLVNGYQCNCAAGYTGQNCQIDIDECQSGPCQNGATCVDLINAYQCNCAAGYTGQNCQIDIDECQSTPCQNGATCIDLVNAYRCNCAAGYTGQNCQIDIDECQSTPCQNGATCIDLVNSYQCNCVAGYTGQNCQIDIDECQSTPCQNGATCKDLVNDYQCDCVAGYTGHNCQIDIDDCNPNPCRHGATCIDHVNDYSCVCLPGYTDKNCSTDIDDCSSSPCQNGASCVDQVNDYTCLCPVGFTGKNCQTDIDDCAGNPCRKRGVCVDKVAAFTCQCPPGFTGVLCQTGFNFCASSPCLNGATCINGFRGFTCRCLDGWDGKMCGYRKRTPGGGAMPAVTVAPGGGGGNAVGVTHVAGGSPYPQANPNSANGYNNPSPGNSPGGGGQRPGLTGIPGSGQPSINFTNPLGPSGGRPGHPYNFLNTAPKNTCPLVEYSHCRCVVSPHHTPDSRGPDRAASDFLAGFIGFPIGLGLSVATYFLLRWCLRHCCASGGARARPPTKYIPDKTRNWVNSQLPPVESPYPVKRPPVPPSTIGGRSFGANSSRSGNSMITNIYRATFGDDNIHSTGPKKYPNTYTTGAKDWS